MKSVYCVLSQFAHCWHSFYSPLNGSTSDLSLFLIVTAEHLIITKTLSKILPNKDLCETGFECITFLLWVSSPQAKASSNYSFFLEKHSLLSSKAWETIYPSYLPAHLPLVQTCQTQEWEEENIYYRYLQRVN